MSATIAGSADSTFSNGININSGKFTVDSATGAVTSAAGMTFAGAVSGITTLAVTGAITESPRAASYQWTPWNPSDIAATNTNAPATATATVTATNYITMANSSGTVTFTFSKAGNYLCSGSLWMETTDSFTLCYEVFTIGGNATRLFTATSISSRATGLVDLAVNTISFLVAATAGQTLTILPIGAVTKAGGATSSFTFSANWSCAYTGTT